MAGELVKFNPSRITRREVEPLKPRVNGLIRSLQLPERVVYERCPVPKEYRGLCEVRTGGCLSWLKCPAEVEAPPVVAFGAYCVVAREPFAAYWFWQENGHYKQTQTGQLNRASYEALFCRSNISTYRLDPADIESVKCPWCGVFGRMLLCTRCQTRICYSSVISNLYAQCICGHRGAINDAKTWEPVGVVPKVVA